LSRASVKPAAWGSTRDVTRPAPGWTTRTGPAGTTVKPSPISGTHLVASNDVAPSSRRPMARLARDGEAPPSRRPPSRLGDVPVGAAGLGQTVIDASIPPSSRVPPSRVALDARVQTLGEALSEARAEAAHLRAELEIARRAFASQADAFERDTGELLAGAERELVRLAMVVARRIVLSELSAAPALVTIWAREVIEGAGFGAGLAVAVAPDVARALPSEAWGDLAQAVVTDAHLAPGAVEVRDGARSVAVTADARLEVVADAMGVATGSAAEPAPARERDRGERDVQGERP
jgi:hypothetical protein